MSNFNFGTSILPTSDNIFSLGSASKRWKINDSTIPTFDTIYPVGAIYISISNTDPGVLFGGTWEAIGGQFLIGANSSYTAGDTGGSATISHTHTMAHTHTMSHTHSQVATTSGGPSTNTSGGNNNATAGPSNNTSGSTAISVAQMPSHNHSENDNLWANAAPTVSNYGIAYVNSGSQYYHTVRTTGGGYRAILYTGSAGSGSGHTHTLSSHTHTMSSHTHTLSSHTHSTSATTTGGASNATTSAASNATTSDASNTNNMPPYLVVYMWKRVA